jgi:cell division protein FtsB
MAHFQVRDDAALRLRIAALEEQLAASEQENTELRAMVKKLTEKLAQQELDFEHGLLAGFSNKGEWG